MYFDYLRHRNHNTLKQYLEHGTRKKDLIIKGSGLILLVILELVFLYFEYYGSSHTKIMAEIFLAEACLIVIAFICYLIYRAMVRFYRYLKNRLRNNIKFH